MLIDIAGGKTEERRPKKEDQSNTAGQTEDSEPRTEKPSGVAAPAVTAAPANGTDLKLQAHDGREQTATVEARQGSKTSGPAVRRHRERDEPKESTFGVLMRLASGGAADAHGRRPLLRRGQGRTIIARRITCTPGSFATG